jgi:predicted nucleic acid-binding protein
MGLAVLDTSVVIAWIDDHDALHRRAVDAVRTIRQEHEVVISVVTYAEALVGALVRDERAVQAVETFVQGAPARDLAPEMARRAAVIRADHGLALPDAMILGTAIELDADVVLTADRRWKNADPRVQVV